MFERFTEKAARTLFFARFEVTQRGGQSIEPEHLMLGLLREGGQIDSILRSCGISPDELRTALGQDLESAEEVLFLSPESRILFSERARRVLDFAAREADDLRHLDIGREHLLLGVLRLEQENPERPLHPLGLGLREVRNEIIRLRSLKPDDAAPADGITASDRIERIERLLFQIMQAARAEPQVNNLLLTVQLELEALKEALRQPRDEPGGEATKPDRSS